MAPKDTPATVNSHARVRRHARLAGALSGGARLRLPRPRCRLGRRGSRGHRSHCRTFSRAGGQAAGDRDPRDRRQAVLTPNTGIAAEATWADRFRDSDRDGARLRYRGTRKWHFIDLELAGADPEAGCDRSSRGSMSRLASQGPADDCIVHKIDEFSERAPATLLRGLPSGGWHSSSCCTSSATYTNRCMRPTIMIRGVTSDGSKTLRVDKARCTTTGIPRWCASWAPTPSASPRRSSRSFRRPITRVSAAEPAASWALESYTVARQSAYWAATSFRSR